MDAQEATQAPPADQDAPATPQRKRKERTEVKEKPKLLPPHAVVLHNDDINGMDYVVGALMRVFRYSAVKCVKLMLRAHFAGQVVVWSGSFEVAELKAEQLQGAGPDPRRMHKGARPLRVSVEAMP